MIDISYENLFQTIQRSLPDGWVKLIVRAFFVEDSCNVKYYIKRADGTVCDCFDLDYSQHQVLQIIANIHQECASVRDRLAENKKWNALTVVIDNNGNFHTDFDYSETAWNTVKAVEMWQEKYLSD